MDFYTKNKVKHARKSHICELCVRPINIGEEYYQEKGKYLGEFFHRCLHTTCYEMEYDYTSEVDNEFTWEQIIDYVKDCHCGECPNESDCELSIFDCEKVLKNYR